MAKFSPSFFVASCDSMFKEWIQATKGSVTQWLDGSISPCGQLSHVWSLCCHCAYVLAKYNTRHIICASLQQNSWSWVSKLWLMKWKANIWLVTYIAVKKTNWLPHGSNTFTFDGEWCPQYDTGRNLRSLNAERIYKEKWTVIFHLVWISTKLYDPSRCFFIYFVLCFGNSLSFFSKMCYLIDYLKAKRRRKNPSFVKRLKMSFICEML